MKSLVASLVGAYLLSLATSALAVPYTWTDTVSNNATINHGHPTYAWTYDIGHIDNPADGQNPFRPGTDTISSATLLLNFSAVDVRDSFTIKLDSLLADTVQHVSLTSDLLTLQATALAQLNAQGTLSLLINRSGGNAFILTDSVLTASGNDLHTPALPPPPFEPAAVENNGPTPPTVPEPSTFLLVGAALVGVAAFRRKVAV